MDAEDILTQQRRLRQISVLHQHNALSRLAAPAVLDCARLLGLAKGRAVTARTDAEMLLLHDLLLYAAKPGRSRAIDRYAKAMMPGVDDEEAQVLRALCQSRFSLLRIDRQHEVVGLVFSDVLLGGEIWLVEELLAELGHEGQVIAARVFQPAAFAMICLTPLPIDRSMVAAVFHDERGWIPGTDQAQLADDPRFAAAFYRAAIDQGDDDDSPDDDLSPPLPAEIERHIQSAAAARI